MGLMPLLIIAVPIGGRLGQFTVPIGGGGESDFAEEAEDFL